MPCFPVLEDNQGALQLSKNPVSNSNSKHIVSKHIDVCHHFLRELFRQGDISVNHVSSEYQHTDLLIKVLAFDFFAIHRRFSMWDLVDQQVNVVCMSVCVSFQVLTQLGGCTNPSRKERKGSGARGNYKASIRFTRRGGLKRIRLQIADRSADRCQQDMMLGWVSIFALWDTCSGYQYYCSGKLRLMIRFLLSSTQLLSTQHCSK